MANKNKLSLYFLSASFVVGGSAFGHLAHAVESNPLCNQDLQSEPAPSLEYQNLATHLSERIREEYSDHYYANSTIVGDPSTWMGLPRTSAEILLNVDAIFDFQSLQTPYGNTYLQTLRTFQMDPIEVVQDLNRFSRAQFKSHFGSKAVAPSRLVFALYRYFDGVIFDYVFWEPLTNQILDHYGNPVPPQEWGTLSPLSRNEENLTPMYFLHLTSLGIYCIQDPNIFNHDIASHFLSGIRYIDLILEYRAQLTLITKRFQKLLRDRDFEGYEILSQRLKLFDEYNWFVISDPVEPLIQKIGLWDLPQKILSSSELEHALKIGFADRQFSLTDLRTFTHTLQGNRHRFFTRFGGAVSDGYNDGHNPTGMPPFIEFSPFGQLSLSAKLVHDLKPGQENAEIPPLLHALSIFLTAARLRIPLEEFIRYGYRADPDQNPEFWKSRFTQYFEQTYGGRPEFKSLMTVVFGPPLQPDQVD